MVLQAVGCRDQDESLTVTVSNQTESQLVGITVELRGGDSEDASWTQRIEALPAGAQTVVRFPVLRSEGSFRVSAWLNHAEKFVQNVGYVDHSSSERHLVFYKDKENDEGIGVREELPGYLQPAK
jgi:hypothetical protein